jgi:hypothetical protein
MRVLLSGASGLIGTALQASLRARGDEAGRLVRGAARGPDEVSWRPDAPIDPALLCDFDAIVHLAGRPVAARWTPAVRREILESRVTGTRLLAESAARSFHHTGSPRIFVSVSAAGYYGNRCDEWLDEQSEPGEGFLSMVAQQWEAATWPAQQAGLRVAMPRLGLVLSKNGGALAPMRKLFRWGLGGRLGSGSQYWSWISLADAVAAFGFVLDEPSLCGPVNFVSPSPATNEEFTERLAYDLQRPAFCHLPAFVLRLALGQMAGEMLLASQRILPTKLIDHGFGFRDESLAEALLRCDTPTGGRIREEVGP